MQWLMLQQDKPEDFVIATGRMETVRKFIEITAKSLVGIKTIKSSNNLENKGINEIGIRQDTGQVVIRIDS